ncbi:carboxymuconolactone decarboxylase family protein [Oligosphaera ethanolica]|uniref:4-carboxymuconolactone decarboxylase n=1 Tax=Oligosphaera ethanolica TaxID=760260 RepID=A0AAE3VJ39_9BACT|nr:carboxymuconolactone decarboxylase family protein [Oligosphaera ethanolica]MDQ0291335.1 4-carboxymuconolactone decarboxylase [Oligosphaera ethanolica]
MSKSERFQQGAARLQDMGNNSPIGSRLLEVCPDLNDYIREFAFGDVHSRPGLSKREHELVILSAIATLGYAPVELKSHINMALNVGVTRAEILEVFIQLAVYAGFPAAVNAVFTAKEVFDERDQQGLDKDCGKDTH